MHAVKASSFTDTLFNCCLVPSHNSFVGIYLQPVAAHSGIRSTHEVVDADVAGALMYSVSQKVAP